MESTKPATQPAVPPPKLRLMEHVTTRFLSQAICIATKRGIANIVTSQSPVHISEVSKKLDCHETNLYRLMSYLSGYGIFEERDGHYFIGNEMSEPMREDAPDSCYYAIQAFGSPTWSLSMPHLEMALDKNNEKTPFEFVNGEPFYQFLAHNPEESSKFDLAVKSHTSAWQMNVPNCYDFNRYNTVVEMAGGCGVLIKAILLKCPQVQHGILFEVPTVIKNVLPELMNDPGLKSRFRAVEGNFLEKVDVVADLYMVAMTLHCFEERRLKVIINNIATAMRQKPGSRLMIIETDYEKSILPNKPGPGKTLDMNMMLVMGGLERDFNTWQTLLNSCGVKVLQKNPFPPGFMGMECELA